MIDLWKNIIIESSLLEKIIAYYENKINNRKDKEKEYKPIDSMISDKKK